MKMTSEKQVFVKHYLSKGNWITIKTNAEEITEEQYENIVSENTLRWFRNLGGKETATLLGKKVIELVSTSPDGTNRTIRKFNFK